MFLTDEFRTKSLKQIKNPHACKNFQKCLPQKAGNSVRTIVVMPFIAGDIMKNTFSFKGVRSHLTSYILATVLSMLCWKMSERPLV